MLKNIYNAHMNGVPLNVNPGQTQSNSMLNKDGAVKQSTNTDGDLSKMGMKNIFTGTKDVLNNTKNQIIGKSMDNNKETNLTESEIFSLLNEGLTEHIQKHANKYASGALIGGGLAAGHVATGGEFGLDDTPAEKAVDNATPPSNKSWNEQAQKEIDDSKMVTRTTDVTKTGPLDKINNYIDDRSKSNQIGEAQDALNHLNDVKNGQGSFLSTGEKFALGGAATIGGLSAGALKVLKMKNQGMKR